jgi:protein phosphatase
VSQHGAFDVFGLTHTSSEFPVNEDQFLIARLNTSLLVHQANLQLAEDTRAFSDISDSRGHLLLVADGLAGRAFGKTKRRVAANPAMDYVLGTMPWYLRLMAEDEDDLEDELEAALQRCRAVGTMFTMACVIGPRLYVLHAGDRRCYLLRGSTLEQATTNHTGDPGMSRALWDATGAGTDDLTPDVHKARLQTGDALLLCSRGLTRRLDDDAVRDVLRRSSTAEEACRWLTETAGACGGTGNITVIVAYVRRVDDAGPGAGAPRPLLTVHQT